MQSHWYRDAFPGPINSARRKSMDFETTRGLGGDDYNYDSSALGDNPLSY